MATQRIYRRDGLLTRAAALADYWADGVHSLKGLPHVIDLRNLGLIGAIELEPIAGKPGARNAVLHDIERLHHDGRQPGLSAAPEDLAAQRTLATEHASKSVRLRKLGGDVTVIRSVTGDDGAASEQVGIEIDRDHQSGTESARC